MSVLNQPITLGKYTFPNRIVFQPMEGCDCNSDGTPSELTVAKYVNAAKSGAGLIWMEANAVCPEGRTNPGQLMLTKENLEEFKSFVSMLRETAQKECGIRPVIILQLTQSGRQSIVPMIAYRHPIYEERRPMTDANIVSDEYLDTVPDLYAESARLAVEAGFDGIDVKSCHGYLFQELLSAFSREGRYGGSFENRTRLYLDSLAAVKRITPENILLATRLSVADMVPYPYGFGTTEEGELDLTEPDMLIDRLSDCGIKLLNVTVGNPYYNPHINRPYRKGAYIPPEEASVGLKRFEIIESHIKERHPELVVVGSGMSYYRENLFTESERLIKDGICDLVGYGRMWLAYPDFYKEFTRGSFETKKCCVACSKCTELMRGGRVSGCAVFNPYYRELYKEMKG